jgi:hypothetical protein
MHSLTLAYYLRTIIKHSMYYLELLTVYLLKWISAIKIKILLRTQTLGFWISLWTAPCLGRIVLMDS